MQHDNHIYKEKLKRQNFESPDDKEKDQRSTYTKNNNKTGGFLSPSSNTTIKGISKGR